MMNEMVVERITEVSGAAADIQKSFGLFMLCIPYNK